MSVLNTVGNLNILFNKRPGKKDIETDTKVCHKYIRGASKR